MNNAAPCHLLAIAISMTLTACGGSGGANNIDSSDNADSPQTNTPTESRPAASAPVNGYILRRMDVFDANGQLTETRYLDPVLASNRINYSSAPASTPDARIPVIEFTYDESGNRTSRTLLNADGGVFLRYESLLDSDGYAVEENLYRADGTLNSSDTFEYNNKRQLILAPSEESNRQGVVFGYDDQGRLASTTEAYRTIDLSSTRKYLYLDNAESPNRIEHFVDDADQPAYFYELDYDVNGNLTSLATQSASGPGRSFQFSYEQSPEPVFNYWLDQLRYYPHSFRNL